MGELNPYQDLGGNEDAMPTRGMYNSFSQDMPAMTI